MQHEFWHQKWQANELGFHQTAIHPLLQRHWPELALAGQGRVLVPLCGKSSDMLMLARAGHSVLGVELSEIAAQAFFTENDLPATQRKVGGFTRYCAGDIEMLCGDFFRMNQALAGNVKAVFDRAALVALPAAMRLAYVNKVRELTAAGAQLLLVTLNYADDEIKPPPFAVPEEEVRELYQGWCEMKLLGETEAELKGRRALEVAYQLTVR